MYDGVRGERERERERVFVVKVCVSAMYYGNTCMALGQVHNLHSYTATGQSVE